MKQSRTNFKFTILNMKATGTVIKVNPIRERCYWKTKSGCKQNMSLKETLKRL